MKKIKPNNYDLFFCVPIQVPVSKKKDFILNLNKYRNSHWNELGKAKSYFHDYIKNANIEHETFQNPVRFHYIYYPKSKHIFDRMNVASIIDKFLCDALIDVGILKDDTYDLVLFPTFEFGGVDKEYPRCEVYIEEIKHKEPKLPIDRLIPFF